jgi:hypothetical protein
VKPLVDKGMLIEWWNGLVEKAQDRDQRRRDSAATVEDCYEYGRDGTVMPDIGGGVKKRKSQRK